MSRFRKCMREEIASRFEVKSGTPSREAQSYKCAILQTFVRHGTCVATRRILLVLCPNGDWRAPKVQYYVAPGKLEATNQSTLLEHVTAGLITALCASQPEVYPRHRWTGADISTDRLGVLESCHRLLSTTYLRFLASYEPASRAGKLLAMAAHGPPQPQSAGLEPQALEDALGSQMGHRGPSGGKAERQEQLGPQETHAAGDAPSWAEVNAKHRRLAAEWVMQRPLAKMLLQRMVMEPLRALMAAQFTIASDEWEQKQLAAVAEAAARGDTGWGTREYRVSVAASGSLEKRFFEQLQVLLGRPEMWQAMPTSALTASFCALGFKLVSRSGCCVLELLQHPHEQMPMRMFRLLSDPEAAKDLLKLPACRWDPWSLQLREAHPSLSGDEFFAKIAMVAHMLWVDISKVEAKHATIRRILSVTSAHTHQQSLADLSAFWCFLQMRKLRARSLGRPTSKAVAKKVTLGLGLIQNETSRGPDIHVEFQRMPCGSLCVCSDALRFGLPPPPE